MTYRKYGYAYGPKVVVTAKVANTGDIADGDIVVHDAVGGATGAGYIKQWSTASDAVVGVALEACSAPTSDGDVEIQIVLALPTTVFTYPASTVTEARCFKRCDIDGAQSINFDKDNFQNVWIVKVDEDDDLVDVIFLQTVGNGASPDEIDYGAA